MINKEDKYREELFKLLMEDLDKLSDDENILNLIREIFISDNDKIDNDELLRKINDI